MVKGDSKMERIKAFLRRDSNILRNFILLLIASISGAYKLITDHRVLSVFLGIILITGSIVILLEIINELKRLNRD